MKITVIKAAEGLNSKQRIKIAKNSTDPKELSRLAYDNSKLVRLAVLENRNTPSKIVDMLCREFADDGDWRIIEKVAKKTNDPEILAKLADDHIDVIRETVAERTDDPEILAKLANDDDPNVRHIVAEKTDDPEILAKLADDEDWPVREKVARKIDDPEFLAKLADDENKNVRRAAAERLNSTNNRPRSSSRRTTQTDWSISLYSISNYSEIEDEIDQVIDAAAEAYAAKYLGGTATVDSPSGVYDSPNGILTITFDTPEGPQSYSIDAGEILGPATSQNKKQKCVQKVLQWLENNL